LTVHKLLETGPRAMLSDRREVRL